MHYFIDHLQLSQQILLDSFGIDSNDSNKFNITSKFQLATNAKAFACQDGMIIVQQSYENPDLINLILKPIKTLKIPLSAVKYYIYRGILKDSLITGSLLKPKAQAPENSFLKKIWENVESFKLNMNLPNHPDPNPKDIGYDNSLSDSLLLEKIFDNSQPDTNAIYIREGDWIGDFGILTKIGFEIILETDNFNFTEFNNQINLNYLRKGSHFIDVNGLTGFEKRAKQELILSYIDPSAFFGLHYENGINISIFNGNNKIVENKNKENLYALLLDKFITKNRVYLDIRSEKGYSYNFHLNYNNGDNKNIKIGNSTIIPTEQIYETNSWPIIFIDVPITNNSNLNNVKINLRIDDNLKPILYLENTKLLDENNNGCFLDETKILDDLSTDWSKDINLFFPNTGTEASKNNVSYYIKLYYFRQEYNALSPNTVIKNEFYFDTTFCPIDLSNIGESDYLFNHTVNSDLNFTRGLLPDIPVNFSYVAQNGAQWDANRILFYNKALFNNNRTGVFFDTTANSYSNSGFNLQGDFNKMSFLSKDIQINKNTIQEIISAGVFQTIKVLDILKNNGFLNTYEDLLCLGITQVEFNVLKNLTGFTNKCHRYIYTQEINGSPFHDKDQKKYRKFELKVQGLNSIGNQLIVSPTTPIYVYTQNGLVFASKNFTEQETTQQTEIYQRNFEEKAGLKIKPNTTKTYEDYFIGDINPNMKVEVDGFINTLATIANDTNAYANIKTLVKDNASGIWNEAVSFVQANANTTPDDRPLYWARIKMQVALKSHLYFVGQHIYSSGIQGSEINVGSDLEKIIQIFEEKSRNYRGVDFSLAPVGAKKILITGFDPFQFDNNVNQSNPSGVCASFLHNKTLGNGFVQTMIFPVRYRDFDGKKSQSFGKGNGIVENYVAPFIGHNVNQADMIITISQNGEGNYNIDRFATINRGGGSDNLNAKRELNSDSVILNETEKDLIWIETTLPKVMAMNGGASQQADSWKHFAVYAQHYTLLNETSIIPELPKYKLSPNIPFDNFTPDNPNEIFTTIKKPHNLLNINNKKKRIIDGSGSNYLSNEIFYRVALARERWQQANPTRPKFPSGHFHIAYIQKATRDLTKKYFFSNRTIYDELTKLLKTVEERIILGANCDLDNPNNLF